LKYIVEIVDHYANKSGIAITIHGVFKHYFVCIFPLYLHERSCCLDLVVPLNAQMTIAEIKQSAIPTATGMATDSIKRLLLWREVVALQFWRDVVLSSGTVPPSVSYMD
jgi:hypothetical protein